MPSETLNWRPDQMADFFNTLITRLRIEGWKGAW